jgi:hypothetical protein
MKTFLTMVALMTGLVLVAFGNDWGLLGLVPGFLWMLKEDIKEELES